MLREWRRRAYVKQMSAPGLREWRVACRLKGEVARFDASTFTRGCQSAVASQQDESARSGNFVTLLGTQTSVMSKKSMQATLAVVASDADMVTPVSL